jgi:predicted nucleotide-binding protein
MPLSGRKIARLAQPFEGGSGPSHTRIDRIWAAEDASEYLPEDATRADKVLGGLRALRDGRRASYGKPKLPPDPAKLSGVAGALAELLISQRLVKDDDVAEALDAPAPTPEAVRPAPTPAAPQTPTSSAVQAVNDLFAPIFVVHGHDELLQSRVVRMLERATAPREVIVLHEQADSGRTLLEKFEAYAGAASYAVVLLTPDDVGGLVGGPLSPRGRQNVIFELGYFFGKLGRERVAVLLAPEVERPSDIAGLVYIEADPDGAWKYRLARELEGAGIDVKHNRIP